MSYMPEPVTRTDKYLAYIAGNMDVILPEFYPPETWRKMVEQAKERGKLTDEEYHQLIN